jgi:hypothetical protein
MININDLINNSNNILNFDESNILTIINNIIGDDIHTKSKSYLITSSLVLYPTISMVKYKYNININEPFENNKNIIYDKLTESYYYNFSLNKKQHAILDIIENIRCNYELSKLFFLYNLEINCDINKVMLPLVNMYYIPINFLIKIYKQDIINIDFSFDAYTIANKNRKQFGYYTMINNEKLIFEKGRFIGYNNWL